MKSPFRTLLLVFTSVAWAIGIARVRANSLAQFRTVLGDVEVELFDVEKPGTVANFKRYVEAGAYHNSFFHRAVHNFVLQGGGFWVTNRSTTNARVTAIKTFDPITNEFNTGPFRSNVAGTIAMAKSSNPNSATSQFFFNLVDNSHGLDNITNSGGFTVFGRVLGDTNVLAIFNSFVGNRTPLTNLIVNGGGVFRELPVLEHNTNSPTVARLVYVDVSLLSVHVADLSGDRHEISWENSPSGTNLVEFTTALPPVWESLTNVVSPNLQRNAVVDETPATNRFYRVRISD